MLKGCEDEICSEKGVTTEQYAVLVTIKYLNGPAMVTAVVHWSGRRVNSVSMIVDRMVKAGLIRRVRDMSDRRVVWLFITSKGENILEPATSGGWDFIQKSTLPLSREVNMYYL